MPRALLTSRLVTHEIRFWHIQLFQIVDDSACQKLSPGRQALESTYCRGQDSARAPTEAGGTSKTCPPASHSSCLTGIGD